MLLCQKNKSRCQTINKEISYSTACLFKSLVTLCEVFCKNPMCNDRNYICTNFAGTLVILVRSLSKDSASMTLFVLQLSGVKYSTSLHHSLSVFHAPCSRSFICLTACGSPLLRVCYSLSACEDNTA